MSAGKSSWKKIKGAGDYMLLKTTGLRSLAGNASRSARNVSTVMGGFTNMISSIRNPDGNKFGEHVKVEALSHGHRLLWLKQALSEMAVWLVMLLLLLSYLIFVNTHWMGVIVLSAFFLRMYVVTQDFLVIRKKAGYPPLAAILAYPSRQHK